MVNLRPDNHSVNMMKRKKEKNTLSLLIIKIYLIDLKLFYTINVRSMGVSSANVSDYCDQGHEYFSCLYCIIMSLYIIARVKISVSMMPVLHEVRIQV